MTETRKRTTTVAKSNGNRVVLCQGCTNPDKYTVHTSLCKDCGQRVAICEECESEEFCPSCATRSSGDNSADGIDEGKTDSGETKRRKGVFDGTEMPQKDRNTGKAFEEGDPNEGSEKVAAIVAKLKRDHAMDLSRNATALSLSYKLALAGLIQPNEIDTNAKMYIDSGMSNEHMVKQASMWMRSVQGATDRVASRYTENSVRTASKNSGIATNPSFGGTNSGSPAVTDLHLALKDIFSTPQRLEE
jgi:hypothetical protein